MPWTTSYSASLKDAESGKKPLLLDFHTGWCPHCTRMDKTTWKDAALIELATKHFVVAKINADVEKAPVSRYRLTGYPTVIVAEPGGDQVLRMEGYKDAAAITAALKAYLGSADQLAAAFAALRADKKDSSALMTIGRFHASVGLHAEAAESFLKALKSSTGAAAADAAGAAASSLVRAGKAGEAEKTVRQGLEVAGAAPTAALLLAAGQVETAQGRAEAARSYYQRVVSEFAASPQAAEAQKALGAGAAQG
jgi:thioredoxin-like negative regulator of GroEL